MNAITFPNIAVTLGSSAEKLLEFASSLANLAALFPNIATLLESLGALFPNKVTLLGNGTAKLGHLR